MSAPTARKPVASQRVRPKAGGAARSAGVAPGARSRSSKVEGTKAAAGDRPRKATKGNTARSSSSKEPPKATREDKKVARKPKARTIPELEQELLQLRSVLTQWCFINAKAQRGNRFSVAERGAPVAPTSPLCL